MTSQGQHSTKPELALRRELHRLGLRYRVDCQIIQHVRRRADVVFARARVAVFVDGCFWHVCPHHGTRPKANAAWWAQKLDRNVSRDRETDDLLAGAGWLSVRIWEHQNMCTAARAVQDAVRRRQIAW